MKRARFLSSCWLVLMILLPCTVVSQDIQRHLHLGDSLYYSHPDSSYYHCRCAEQAAVQKKDENQLAQARLCKVRYLILKTKYTEATNDLNKAVDFFKKNNNKNELARAYNLKAILLERLGDNESKYNYENEAVRLYEETGNIDGQAKMLGNLALDYTYEGRFKEAEACLDKILLMIDRLKQVDVYYYYQDRGVLYLHKKEYEKAVLNLETAMSIAHDKQMVDSEITAMTDLAEANIKLGKFALALEQLEKARELAIKNKLNFELDEVYSKLIELYVQEEKYKLAYETLDLRSVLREKSDHLQSLNRISEEDERNELRYKMNTRLEQLKVKNGNLENQIKQVKTTWWIFVIATAVLLFLLMWMVSANRRLKNKLRDQRVVIERLHNKDRN